MKIEIGTNEAGQRLDKFLRKYLKDVPLSAIFKALRKGDIRVNGKKQKEKYSLLEGDVIEIRYLQSVVTKEKKKPNFQMVDSGSLQVVYEDENMLLVEKWPGVLVHSDKKNGAPTLTDYVLSYLFRKGDYVPENELTFTPASCNRLDRNTSGIVFFGKNFEGLKLLNEMIRERKVKKYYCALVKGKIQPGKYEAYISKDDELNKSTAHLGNPIVGDFKYGDNKMNSFFENKFGLTYQFLYAYKVTFKEVPEKFDYLKNKTIAQGLPPMFKKIKKDVFKFRI